MRTLTLLLFPIALSAVDLQIDHVSIAGRDLTKLRSALTAAGIPTEYGGRHSNHATEMAVSSFPDGSYLELIALQPDADPKAVAAHDWSVQLRRDAGPAAWAIRVDDIAAERNRLQTAKIDVSQPERSGRARPDGFRLDWETAQVGKENRGTFFPFLIRDFTPRDERAYITHESGHGKPTTSEFRGIKRVVIVARNLPAAIERFRAAYDWPAPTLQDDRDFGAHLAIFANTPVVLAAPLNAKSPLWTRISHFGDGPCAYVFAAPKLPALKFTGKTHWAGADIHWLAINGLNAEETGWRLGVE